MNTRTLSCKLAVIALSLAPALFGAQAPASVANSAENHQELARAYQAKAERLDAAASRHEALARAYRTNPASLAAATKNPMAPNTAAHCEYFARNDRQAAAAARAEARHHARLAQDGPAGQR